VRTSGPWLNALLVNHLWGLGDVTDNRKPLNTTFIQPVIAYTFPSATTVFLSSETTRDWSRDTWLVPLQLGGTQLVPIGGQPGPIRRYSAVLRRKAGWGANLGLSAAGRAGVSEVTAAWAGRRAVSDRFLVLEQDDPATEAKMSLNRRELLQAAGGIVGGTMLAGNEPAAAQTARSGDFSIDTAFAEFMRNIGGTPNDSGGSVTFTGHDPIVRSHFRIGTCMAVPAMAAAVGAAAIWRERTGESQDASIDLRQAVYGVAPWMRLLTDEMMALGAMTHDPLPSDLTWQPSLNGRSLQGPLILGNPLSFGIFETRDGRLVTPRGIYPQHFTGFLSLIGAAPNRRSIAENIKTFYSDELEQMVGKSGNIMGIHRTADEWLQHPQGKYLTTVPLIEIVKIGDSAPIPWTPAPGLPLAGIKALACTHVIASTTAARTLAGYGAEVLHITRDQSFEHDAIYVDCNVGMRSTLLNLKDPAQNKVLQGLLPQADVFLEGFRGRKVGDPGFGPEEIASRKPGIVYLSLRAYGWEGPWRDFAGFDMEACTVTGFTMAEGGG